ncbi:hypothetical protein V5O48_019456, partial [Marasmius crinis-equi]
MAFIADYQGDDKLLTDPQIITHPALSHTFVGGNNSDCYWEMEVWHECNHFCKHYLLPQKWGTIEKAPMLEMYEQERNITRPSTET